ncbi:hypothetical protein Tco_0090863 [Tanacetum coccineum]
MGKGKLERNRVFTISLKHDGVFIVDPFHYLNGDEKKITNIDIEGTPLKIEHNGYDALDIRDQAKTMFDDQGNESSDAYCSSDDEDLGFVDFHTEGDDNVVIKTLTTNDPFLSKLCSNSGHFRDFIDENVNDNVQTVVEDTENIDPQSSYARVMIELRDDVELKDNIVVAIPNITMEGHYICNVRVEYEWKPHRYASCKVFGHIHEECLKNTCAEYRHVPKKPIANSSGTKKKGVESTIEVSNSNPFEVLNLVDNNEELGTNGGTTNLVNNGVTSSGSSFMNVDASPWNAILDSNPGSTCRLNDKKTSSDNYYFRRNYVCFKGVRDGWLACCRKVIGMDGFFLKHTYRGELLVVMRKDVNNQMYPIAWAVVKVENNENWCLLDVVCDWLPNAEHWKCIRHVFANITKKFIGVHLQRLFWHDASTTLKQHFYTKIEDLKVLSQEAYDYLIQRNPNSWCRAFFSLESKCLKFENEICEIARTLEDTITPSIRKRIELLKDQQRHWMIISSGFQELKLRNCHEAYGVNIHLRKSNRDGLMLTSLASSMCLEVQRGKKQTIPFTTYYENNAKKAWEKQGQSTIREQFKRKKSG